MILSPLLWLALAGPGALVATALLPGNNARALATRARDAAVLALAGAAMLAAVVALAGPVATPALPGLGLLADGLSATMFLLVGFVGCIVMHYARTYMAGDPGHVRFTRALAVTLAAVQLLMLAGDLVLFAAAWLATSLALNRLLLFYGDRPAAILAARKKFIASRLGDACLAGAFLIIWQAFGTTALPGVLAAARGLDGLGGALPLACGLIAVAALLKSAQFPLHGWITEVMETPTPVSALLHAGIVNAGGFLLLRFAPLIGQATGALDLLIIVGGFTALFASVVMLTQNAVKVALAWSTIAQMGFMMLQCGLGAWAPALLHIVAHSLYKAHAFLSSGSVIDIARASWSPSPGGAPHPARLGLAVAGVLAAVAVVGTASGFDIAAQPGLFALGAIMLMGLAHLVTQSIDARPTGYVIVRTAAVAVGVAAAYFALQAGMAALMAGTLPASARITDPLAIAAIIAVVAGFAALTIGQSSFIAAKPGTGRNTVPEWAQAFYVHARNGLYVNSIANRLVLRLWPTGLPNAR